MGDVEDTVVGVNAEWLLEEDTNELLFSIGGGYGLVVWCERCLLGRHIEATKSLVRAQPFFGPKAVQSTSVFHTRTRILE